MLLIPKGSPIGCADCCAGADSSTFRVAAAILYVLPLYSTLHSGTVKIPSLSGRTVYCSDVELDVPEVPIEKLWERLCPIICNPSGIGMSSDEILPFISFNITVYVEVEPGRISLGSNPDVSMDCPKSAT